MDGLIKLPPNFEIRSPCAATEWRFWLQAFEDFLVGTGQENKDDKVKLSLLRNMMGAESARVLLTLPLTLEESKSYKNVLQAIQLYVAPRINEVFERYKFNERKQKPGESFDNFFTDCKQLILNLQQVYKFLHVYYLIFVMVIQLVLTEEYYYKPLNNLCNPDILEFGGKSYLVIVDFLSHWLEIRPLQSKTSKSVIDAFQEVFTRFGYPVEIVSDNNPFKSLECCEYYKAKDISIITSSPHYPRSNGMSEKAVNISKTILKKAYEDGVDYRDYLMAYNNTPLSGLTVSPSQILNSRRVRTCIPVANSLLEPKVETEIHQLLNLKQSIYKKIHDKHAKKEVQYKEGEKIVYRTGKDDYWKKGIVIKKCKEPRSYLICKENDSKPFRRTAEHLRKSLTETNCFKRECFIPPNDPSCIVNCNDEPMCPSIINPSVEPTCSEESVQAHTERCVDTNMGEAVHTRSGRLVKKPFRYLDGMV